MGSSAGARRSSATLPYFVALPTTSGTGSEVGRSSVGLATTTTHVKKIIFSPKLLAKAVFADPELTLDLPPAITAATGMDALTHNVEIYLSPAYHPLCDGIALEGTRIAARSLRTAVREPRNLDARSDMMMSSMMGAIAFQKDLGAVHSCAHALSTVADLHHGLANGIMIDHVMRFNLPAAPAKIAELAHVVGVGGSSARRAAQAFIDWLDALKRDARRFRPRCRRTRRKRAVTHADIPRAGRRRDRRHLPPDQPAAVHARRFRAPLRGGDVTSPATAIRVKVGISACFFHADPKRPIFKGKTLQYVEQTIAHWVMSTRRAGGDDPVAGRATRSEAASRIGVADYARELDALVLRAAPTSGPRATARRR